MDEGPRRPLVLFPRRNNLARGRLFSSVSSEEFEVEDVTKPIHWSHTKFARRITIVVGKEAWRVLGLPTSPRHFDRFFVGRFTRFVLIPHPVNQSLFYEVGGGRRRVNRLLKRVARRKT